MTNDMTTGNPAKIIFLFALPILLGSVFQQFYSMADTIIVGRFIDYKALAAVGSTGSMSFLILGFVMGLSSGFAVIVAQRFGAKDEEGVRRSVATSIFLCTITTIIFTTLSMVIARPLLVVMNTPDDIFQEAYTYIMIIFAGTGAIMFYNMASSILRALGDSKTPLYFLIISSILNIILDIVFIVTFKMGVAGAALATVVSQIISVILCVFYMIKHYPILHLTRKDFQLNSTFAWKHLSLGLPMAFQFSITAIGVIILQSSLNLFGSVKIAAFTAASKVEGLVCQGAPTFGVAMANYTGQNLGADNIPRIRKGVVASSFLTLGFSFAASFIVILFAEPLTKLFITDVDPMVLDEIYAGAREYLKMCAIFFPSLFLLFIYRNVLQGIGKSFWPLMGGVIELVIRSIVAFTLPKVIGYTGICLAGPLAWVGACVLLFIAYIVTFRKMHSASPS
ncbi:MATE family efflux transporter [Anaeromicropila populeti]|uniref:Probable multidrug resistance protein NorM n=1 Tax=Anaeromicropila populeti TaxID=37658 RepID=A0A1I6I6P0_9FIRM|nr:MATE family efflux transporter [Anaeromicropila populeti]SFR62373.1 putative efflux protein, MATE family [Anaeromicropila populeti]